MRRRWIWIAGAVGCVVAAGMTIPPVRRVFHPVIVRLRGQRTVADRLSEFADAKRRVLKRFAKAGVAYPPGTVILLGLKEEKRLEVYAGASGEQPKLVAAFPIVAASGSAGPKLRQGDGQVPEGIYAVESLNPNSRYHVALRVGYPNAFDRRMAERDGRTKLGGDIMIHGSNASIGCLAMGDPAAEELFVIAAECGIENVTIVLAPWDLRTRPRPEPTGEPWRGELYDAMQAEMVSLVRP